MLSTSELAIGFLPLVSNILAQADPEVVVSINEPQISSGQIFSGLLSYLISAFFCQKIFAKCGVENAWFAWIPFLGTYANFKAGDEPKPVLWTILAFIPLINIVAFIWLIRAWIRIFKKLGKSPWLLLTWLIPFGAIICLGYLAFT
ncbi:MAG: DUF5684 domain-containing protein [Microcoleaceae cyanobacterium]